jgi:hypothetical protein
MTMLLTPASIRCRVTSSMVSPAPTSSALQSVRSVKMRRATSTAAKATDTGFSPIAVSVRTFLAMEKPRGNRRPELIADGARVAGDGEGGLQLAEDLRLAEDHGIEPAATLHDVPQRLLALVVVGGAAQLVGDRWW